jgi:hypothetical protein
MSVDLTGVINFYSHTIDGSLPCMDATPKFGYPKTSYVQISTQLTIYDLQRRKKHFHLDKNGFEVHKYQGNIHNVFHDHSEKQQSYYEDIRKIH